MNRSVQQYADSKRKTIHGALAITLTGVLVSMGGVAAAVGGPQSGADETSDHLTVQQSGPQNTTPEPQTNVSSEETNVSSEVGGTDESASEQTSTSVPQDTPQSNAQQEPPQSSKLTNKTSGITPMAVGADGAAPPYVYWTVKDNAGNLIGGASFTIQGPRDTTSGSDSTDSKWNATNNRTVTDCTTAPNPCPANSFDRDPDPGEFLVANIGANNSGTPIDSNLRYRVRQATVPSGRTWVDTNNTWQLVPGTRQNPSANAWSGQTYNFGNFAITSASIKVTAGGDRTADNVTQGNGLGFAPDGTVFQAQRTNGGTVYTCSVTGGTGSCVITGLPTGGNGWNVSVKSVPSGWFINDQLGTTTSGGSSAVLENYVFQTTSLTNNQTYNVTSSGTSGTWGQFGGTYKTDASSNKRFSEDRLAIPRVNPPQVPACGLNVAFILDQSNSMFDVVSGGKTRNQILKNAMLDVINGLTGTPTQMAIYTFGTNADVAGHTPLTSLANSTTSAPLIQQINSLKDTGSYDNDGATNWDVGLSQLGASVSSYDLVIFFTDGLPTVYGKPAKGIGSQSWFQMVDQAVFSANAIKAKGVPINAVGASISDAGSIKNLQAISGTVFNQDYFIVHDGDQAQFVKKLRDLAGGECNSTLTIQKQIQDYNGNLITPSPSDANGWDFDNSIAGANNSIGDGTTAATGDGRNGFLTVPITVGSGQGTNQVSVKEILAGKNYGFVSAQCRLQGNPVPTTVTYDGAGNPIAAFNLPPGDDQVSSCVFTNRRPTPARLKLVKVVDKGSALPSLWALTAQKGTDPPVINGAKTGTPAAGPVYADPGVYKLSEANGPADYYLKSLACVNNKDPQHPVQMELTDGSVTLANLDDVTCTFTNSIELPRLTLTKEVQNQYSGAFGAGPSGWTLSATGTTSTIQGVSGTAAVTNQVVNAGNYTLAELNGPAGYSQKSLACVLTGTQTPASLTGSVLALGADQDVTCKFTNADLPGTVVWDKVNDSAHPQLLGGSEWQLTGPGVPAGTTVTDCIQATCPSGAYKDQDPTPGKFKLESLTWGDYTLKETKAPPGYIANSQVFTFQVRGNSLNANLNQIVNVQREGPVVPLTGGAAATMFFLIGGGLFGGSLVAAGVRRRRRALS